MRGVRATRGRAGRAGVLAVVVLASTCAACSAGGDPDGPAPSAPTAPATPTGDPTRGAVDAFRAELEALRGLGDAIDQHAAVQEDVAACMNALGFEYTPLAPGADLEDLATATDLGLERGTREYAEQFGFGITTDDMGYYAMSAARLDDPNARYVATLSPAARAEYDDALWGTEQEADPADPDASEAQGCFDQAQARTAVVLEATDALDPDALWAEEMLMREAVLADDRVVSLHEAWGACMADAGFPGLAAPGDNLFTGDAMLAIRGEFETRLMALQAEMTDVDDPSVKLGLAALQVKAELADREIAMAVADVDCRESSGYAAALLEVEIEHQARFFADHRAEFEAYAAAVAERMAAAAERDD